MKKKRNVARTVLLTVGAGVLAVCAWDAAWWFRRRGIRQETYAKALARARQLGRPLVVVGAPDQGITSGPGCGDVTVDIVGSNCPNSMTADITKPLQFADNSVVIFESCVLECVDDVPAAIRELQRVSGGEIFPVRVEPWTITAFAYPGIKHRMSPSRPLTFPI